MNGAEVTHTHTHTTELVTLQMHQQTLHHLLSRMFFYIFQLKVAFVSHS